MICCTKHDDAAVRLPSGIIYSFPPQRKAETTRTALIRHDLRSWKGTLSATNQRLCFPPAQPVQHLAETKLGQTVTLPRALLKVSMNGFGSKNYHNKSGQGHQSCPPTPRGGNGSSKTRGKWGNFIVPWKCVTLLSYTWERLRFVGVWHLELRMNNWGNWRCVYRGFIFF